MLLIYRVQQHAVTVDYYTHTVDYYKHTVDYYKHTCICDDAGSVCEIGTTNYVVSFTSEFSIKIHLIGIRNDEGLGDWMNTITTSITSTVRKLDRPIRSLNVENMPKQCMDNYHDYILAYRF